MNPAIEALLLQLAALCLRITAQGQWHAHYSLHANVHSVDIYLVPASSKYIEGEARVRPFSQAAYYANTPGYQWQSEAQQTSHIRTELQAMHTDLEAFLVAEPQERAV